ncbi:hypothetical protein [Nostoc sp. CHAB 5715]|uniref:hypothetical protein n=1 Tax=Nostoc sp. CHAB 5715 TaxID=2780400 RepID=UPI001E3EF61B|nr:hypothetical protein [Nostoc sp. CHAB 5715]MCC5622879.1 hypothetical protein [Nostoc sp. CHAB 5715]
MICDKTWSVFAGDENAWRCFTTAIAASTNCRITGASREAIASQANVVIWE